MHCGKLGQTTNGELQEVTMSGMTQLTTTTELFVFILPPIFLPKSYQIVRKNLPNSK